MCISPRAVPRFSLISPENCWRLHEQRASRFPHSTSRFGPPASGFAHPASRFPQMTMIDLRYVKKLVEMLDESSVDSIEISSDKGMKIRISKTPQQRGAVQMTAPMTMPALLPAASAATHAGPSSGAVEVPMIEAAKPKHLE